MNRGYVDAMNAQSEIAIPRFSALHDTGLRLVKIVDKQQIGTNFPIVGAIVSDEGQEPGARDLDPQSRAGPAGVRPVWRGRPELAVPPGPARRSAEHRAGAAAAAGLLLRRARRGQQGTRR